MILIRADGNPQIGIGHIMRCLSLADAFREQKIEIVFVIAEQYCQKLIENRGYVCIVLGTAHNRMEEELPAFQLILKQRQPVLVILDSYYVTLEYMRAIKNEAQLLYIDDQNSFDYPADIVINYELCASDALYPHGKKYLLGPQYAPLRTEFQGLGLRTVRKRVEHILISTGGTDPYHIALRCLDYLKTYPSSITTTFHFILGIMNRDIPEIVKATAELDFVCIHYQETNMCSLMLQCDVAASAAGTTLYELCACGLPTVTYILADNQIQSAEIFQKVGLMPCVGDARFDEKFIEKLFMKIQRLAEDIQEQKRVAYEMQNLVDGNGAKRLVREVLSYIK